MSIRLPWPVKIGAKIVLSRLPVPYRAWARLNLFKHGPMREVDYARFVFDRHFQRSGLTKGTAFTCLELGPGDSLLSAIFARAAGAAKTYIVDTGPFAGDDVELYRRCARDVTSDAQRLFDYDAWKSVDDVLEDCRAVYLTDGLQSLRSIPTGTVHWSWSQAVLEHVRRDEFTPVLRELRRIACDGGVSSHRIDLQDHLGGGLNNLRFSHARWEGPLFARSGFYTNRLRHSEVIEAFTATGFVISSVEVERWPAPPVERKKLDSAFQHFNDEDLSVRWMDVTARARDVAAQLAR